MIDINELEVGSIETIMGSVVELVLDDDDGEDELDGFTLEDDTGETFVDGEEDLDVSEGDELTVVGELLEDDGELVFEALKITDESGEVLLNPFGTSGARPTDDILDGTNDRDRLSGGAGRDYLNGRAGRDILIGGSHGDILIGGRGGDILRGGNGSDQFVYESIQDRGDRIVDFDVAEDVLVIEDVFEDDDQFEDMSIGSLDDVDDFVRVSQRSAGAVIKVDADGSGSGFSRLAMLRGVDAASLSVSNFAFDD